MAAGCFEALVQDLRELVRVLAERDPRPSAAIYDGRTLPSSPASGARAGDDGYKRKKGSKVPIAVDTLGQLLALVVTPVNEQERAPVAALSEQRQEATQGHVELAWVDSGYTGPAPAGAAAEHGIKAGGGQTGRGQARLRALAAPLGGRAILCLAGKVSAAFPRRRTAAKHARRVALAGF